MDNLKFPLFLDMTGRRVMVFGGGNIALRRVRMLLVFGADITVTAPEICEALEALASAHPGNLKLQYRCYAPGDTADAFMVLAATDDSEVNRAITQEAKICGSWANNASCRDDNDFSFPAIAVNEDISVGICGTGADHAAVAEAAARIRRTLSEGDTVCD